MGSRNLSMCKGISRREPGFRVQNWGSVLTLWRRSAKSGERVTFPIKASDYAANRRNSVGQFPRAAFGSSKGTSGAFGDGKGIYRQESVLLIAAALLAGGRPVCNSDVTPFNGNVPGMEELTTITTPCRLIEINPVSKFHVHSGTKMVRSACC